ncbi:MAG: hypothetical protein WC716_16610 [Chitinophagaceae bacterium]|jgi:hypothetical protein
MLTDKKYNEVLKPKMPEGFILIKEYQKWGEQPTIKNYNTGKIMFWFNGNFVTGAKIWHDLKDNWIPVKEEEISYFCNGMDELLKENCN